eukprot:6051994-Alexandrium_andersonii.AAC.1
MGGAAAPIRPCRARRSCPGLGIDGNREPWGVGVLRAEGAALRVVPPAPRAAVVACRRPTA